MEKIFGIDLGTTNSEIAYIEDGKPQVVTVSDGKKYLPSVVGVDEKGKIITGFAARNQYVAYPENGVVSIKRKIGSGEKVSMGGREYTPAQISSHILKTLKNAAEGETGISVKKAVITVPAYFNDAQRSDTILAGELAGLEVVRIINEPTSAALAYGRREDRREKILIYDLGGGTFDISLIDVEEDIIEVVATDGDSKLGGDDCDRLLVQHLLSCLPDGIQPEGDLRLMARLLNLAESTKMALSTRTTCDLKEGFISAVNGNPINLDLVVTRRDFERCIEEILERTFSLTQGVLEAKKLRGKNISKILLVGGSTYMPVVFNTLNARFDCEVHRSVDPTYCVAIGAAIQGAIISGEEVGTILIDVNSHSIGIRCLDISAIGKRRYDAFSAVLSKNTPIPTSMSETYHTVVDNQEEVLIEVYQGEDAQASNNALVGSFSLENLPKKLPAGSEIDVTFTYNLDGVVEVTASERTHGGNEGIKIDVNRTVDIENKPNKPERLDEKKVRRVIKTAEKAIPRIDDQELRDRVSTVVNSLDYALSDDSDRVFELFEELTEILSEI